MYCRIQREVLFTPRNQPGQPNSQRITWAKFNYNFWKGI